MNRCFATTALLLAALSSAPVTAQSTCPLSWTPGLSVNGAGLPEVRALLVHGGPLYAATAGIGSTGDGLRRWSPAGWLTAAPNFNGLIHALASFDPDGPGPVGPSIVAAGDAGVAYFNGTSWVQIGGAFDGAVKVLSIFDPDGPGPLQAVLVAGGWFQIAGGVSASRIAQWDGAAWSPLGLGVSGSLNPSPSSSTIVVNAFALHDPDGAGPTPAVLVVGGAFLNAGAVQAHGIATWNGTAWTALGQGLYTNSTTVDSEVFAVQSFDADGPGPQQPAIVAGGNFTFAGGPVNAAKYIAKWNGASWSALGPGLQLTVRALTVFDLDGAGPANAELIASGDFFLTFDLVTQLRRVGRWNGSAWAPMGYGFDDGATSNLQVRSFVAYPLDGFGAGTPVLVAGGLLTVSGQTELHNVAQWTGNAWVWAGPGISGEVRDTCEWDPDDTGPLPRLLVLAGRFGAKTTTGITKNIVAWDGAAFHAIGPGLPTDSIPYPLFAGVNSVVAWDLDGAGPSLPTLVAGGEFGGTYLLQWNGGSWVQMGMSSFWWGPVTRLLVWDEDGPLPGLPKLFGAGPIFLATAVARWSGASWQIMGAAFPGNINNPTNLKSLAAFDADGPGPLPERLFVAGLIGPSYTDVAMWNGSSWVGVGNGFVGCFGCQISVASMLVLDPDQAGPALPTLVVTGNFTHAAFAIPANGIAAWNGSAWSGLGSGLPGAGGAMIVFDHDGAGLLGPRLLVSVATGGTFTGIREWTGTAWSQFSGDSAGISSFGKFDADGGGPQPESLIAGCGSQVGGIVSPAVPSSGFARWGVPRDVTIAMSQPNGPGSFEVTNASCLAGASYFSAFSLDPQNGSSPGSGSWSGLHIATANVLAEYAVGAPPYLGTLDATGTSTFNYPSGTLTFLAGQTVYANTHLFVPGTFGVISVSPVASVLIQ